MTPAEADARDTADPLAHHRDAFVIADPDVIYLDGNSLGRLPKATIDAVTSTMRDEWGDGLVRSWHDWIDLPMQLGDAIAPLVGASAGEVLVTDQTSVNLFKLAAAAVAFTEKPVIVTDDANFPSDRYVLDGIAGASGAELRTVTTDPVAGVTAADVTAALDDTVGLVSLSHVAFKSGALADMAAITKVAHDAGALTLWDLSHSAGVLPVALNAAAADLAVGCTYKYLNAGPGAPAFLYVRRDLQQKLMSPLRGWFGHDAMFAFEATYRPAPDIRRFAAGTPPILSMRGVDAAVAITADAGIDAIRTKSLALTDTIIERHDAELSAHGFTLGTPRVHAQRGGHVALRHAAGHQIAQALIDRGVIVDFRAPDVVRLGPAPLYTTFGALARAMDVLAEIVRTEAFAAYPAELGGVT
jgi:kynureninase